nr:p43K protein [Molluscum contagiosum virus]AAB29323.1 p43K=envelope protein [Molluscum contagiosum virus subtype I MCV I, Peptide, 388 aa] [Molluscum contagiosum virus subtype 1]
MGNLTSARPAGCKIVETLPATLPLALPTGSMLTYDCFDTLISQTQRELCIASYCCNLRSTPEGGHVLLRLLELARADVRVTIIVDEQSRDADATQLAGVPNLRYLKLDVGELPGGKPGSLLSSFWVSDKRRFYLGSASLTGGSISTIKSLGVYSECEPLARDLRRRFRDYERLCARRCVRCLSLSTRFHLRRHCENAFFSDAPESLIGSTRTFDADAVLAHVQAARSTIDMELLSLVPLVRDEDSVQYWPRMHDALVRAALERNVRVRLLVGLWHRSDVFSLAAVKGLHELGVGHADISVRVFAIPGAKGEPLNNTKLLVVDDEYVHVTSADMDGTHYARHAFVSFNCAERAFARALGALFERDWQSSFSSPLPRAPPPEPATLLPVN